MWQIDLIGKHGAAQNIMGDVTAIRVKEELSCLLFRRIALKKTRNFTLPQLKNPVHVLLPSRRRRHRPLFAAPLLLLRLLRLLTVLLSVSTPPTSPPPFALSAVLPVPVVVADDLAIFLP